MAASKTSLIKWQAPMKKVLMAVSPLVVSAVYFYGWRALVMLVVCNVAAFLTEYAFTRKWKQPVTSAVFVSGTLFTLSLPPTLPYWMAVVGIVFGVLFGKMVFGGFGKNIFNPALTGRAFIYVSFGAQMTGNWVEPAGGALGGFGAYLSDAVTSATPGMTMKTGEMVPLLKLLLGNTAGVIGGTSALLVLIGGIWLVRTKAANYRIVISALAGYLGAQGLLWAFGVNKAIDPLHGIMAGSALTGIFFYATDPVSASQTNQGRWAYGAFIGIMSSLITVFSSWPAGTMFSILLANMFAPIMDHYIKLNTARKKAATKKAD